LDYSFSTKGHFFLITANGRLTKPEVLAFWDVMEQQPGYATAKGMIVVLHSLWWEMTRQEIGELAGMGERFRPVRWAFVVDEEFSFGLVETFTSALRGAATMRAFKDEVAALRWLSSAGVTGSTK